MSLTSTFATLDQIASENTERKTPGAANSSESYYKPDQNSEAKNNTTQNTDTQQTTASPAAIYKMSKEEAEQSGKSKAIMIKGVIENVFGFAEVFRFKMQVPKPKMQQFVQLKRKDKSTFTEEEKSLFADFMEMVEEHKEKEKQISMTPDEVDALTYGYTMESLITGQKTDPRMVGWVTLVNAIVTRGRKIYLG